MKFSSVDRSMWASWLGNSQMKPLLNLVAGAALTIFVSSVAHAGTHVFQHVVCNSNVNSTACTLYTVPVGHTFTLTGASWDVVSTGTSQGNGGVLEFKLPNFTSFFFPLTATGAGRVDGTERFAVTFEAGSTIDLLVPFGTSDTVADISLFGTLN